MAGMGEKWRVQRWILMVLSILVASMFASAERASMKQQASNYGQPIASESDYLSSFARSLLQSDRSGYQHNWPDMKFGFRIVLGTIIGFVGAALGSVGGVGGGGIFVPMLTLIIGFDAKSSTALSKCMIMGAAGSTVCWNLKLRHPTLDMPLIDYDLALLIQPMLMLGISIGVAFNVIFAEWMFTVLLILLFVGTSTKAFFKGVDTWKKETIIKKEDAKRLEATAKGKEGAENKLPPGSPNSDTQKEIKDTEASIIDTQKETMDTETSILDIQKETKDTDTSILDIQKETKDTKVSIIENVCWKELGLLVFVWVSFLALQIIKNYTTTCSTAYWILNLLQIPVSVGVTLYEAMSLYKGRRVIASKGDDSTHLKVHQLLLYSFCGVLAGMVGGLLGVGGGFIMGPMFLELGVPPQVASATSTFAMTFSSSMSVVEYYLLKRFPVPYALYFIAVATVSAFVAQHVVRKLINILGRASLIIFILAFIIFGSALSLGGVGISSMIGKIEQHEYMGFENLCK